MVANAFQNLLPCEQFHKHQVIDVESRSFADVLNHRTEFSDETKFQKFVIKLCIQRHGDAVVRHKRSTKFQLLGDEHIVLGDEHSCHLAAWNAHRSPCV